MEPCSNAPCYGIPSSPCDYSSEKFEMIMNDSTVELDAALQELGMLSTITDGRKDYLIEKEKKQAHKVFSDAPISSRKFEFSLLEERDSLIDGPSCVKYRSVCENNGSGIAVLSEEFFCSEVKERRKALCTGPIKRKRRKEMRSYKPYELTLRSKQEDSPQNVSVALSSERANPPTVSRQDSGNKSNPSSPIKCQNSLSDSGCSIFRSRSLDDLKISKLDLNDSCYIDVNECCYKLCKDEIDTVSQSISKLHVS